MKMHNGEWVLTDPSFLILIKKIPFIVYMIVNSEHHKNDKMDCKHQVAPNASFQMKGPEDNNSYLYSLLLTFKKEHKSWGHNLWFISQCWQPSYILSQLKFLPINQPIFPNNTIYTSQLYYLSYSNHLTFNAWFDFIVTQEHLSRFTHHIMEFESSITDRNIIPP